MPNWDKYVLSRLFIAIPELQIDTALLNILLREGLVSQDTLNTANRIREKDRKYSKIAEDMRDTNLVERIMILMPEILSFASIDILRRWGLINPALGNALRVGLRAVKATEPGRVSEKTILERWAAAGKTALSFDTINLLRDLDNLRIAQLKNTLPDLPENRDAIKELLRISVLRGNILRSVLSTGRLSAETLAAASKANDIWGVLTVIMQSSLSDRLLRDAIRIGVISQSRYELVVALSRLGVNVWKKGVKSFNSDSFEARMLLLSEGILSPEMITALRSLNIISPELADMLYPAARGIRAITRGRLEDHMKGIRARVVPGESAIKSFARISGQTDREILKLLAEAAEQSRRETARLMRDAKFGKLTRSAQQSLITNALHKEMRNVWEGVGHLTIFGEKESARVALAAMDFLQDDVWKKTGRPGNDFRRAIVREANAGIDAYVSRQENLHPFSRRIYKNHLLARDLVGRRVNIGLLRGLTAKEMASSMEDLIRPGAPGGVSYNSMRLARTEINNAFHFSSIRYTREMPWVEGYVWNLSGSHPSVDVCNTMAQTNHDGIGRGTYKKGNVPGKPHPHCLCFITTVTASNSKFEKQLNAGSYDNYLKDVNNTGAMGESGNWHKAYDEQAKELASLGSTSLMVAAAKAIAPVAIALLIV
jgi:hypothetical protein